MANQRFYLDLKMLAKRANQRMVRLEHEEIKSPAYKAVQAQLEMLGKVTKGDRGRRFSETGKVTYNEYEMQKRILTKFLEQTTSTTKGAKSYYDRVYETASEEYGLAERGISKDEWLEFWENMPGNKKDRIHYSMAIKIFKAVIKKQGEEINENEYTAAEIAKEIEAHDNLKDVYSALGLTWREVEAEDTTFNDFVRKD